VEGWASLASAPHNPTAPMTSPAATTSNTGLVDPRRSVHWALARVGVGRIGNVR